MCVFLCVIQTKVSWRITRTQSRKVHNNSPHYTWTEVLTWLTNKIQPTFSLSLNSSWHLAFCAGSIIFDVLILDARLWTYIKVLTCLPIFGQHQYCYIWLHPVTSYFWRFGISKGSIICFITSKFSFIGPPLVFITINIFFYCIECIPHTENFTSTCVGTMYYNREKALAAPLEARKQMHFMIIYWLMNIKSCFRFVYKLWV